MVTQPTWQSGLKLCCFHTCDAHIVLNPSLLSSFSPAAFLLSTVKVEIAMLWSVISSSLLPAYFVFHPLLPPLQATFLSAPSHPDFQKEKYIVSLLISFIVHSFLNPQPTMPDISLKLLFSKSQTSVFSFRWNWWTILNVFLYHSAVCYTVDFFFSPWSVFLTLSLCSTMLYWLSSFGFSS